MAKDIYVSSSIGSNSYSGLSPDPLLKGPLASIQKAINVAIHGDVIYIMAGEYFEQLKLAQKNDLSIKAYGDGQVILYNVYPQFLDNKKYLWNLSSIKKNKKFKNNQYVYSAHLPKEAQDIHSKLASWYPKFNHVFTSNGQLLFGHFKEQNYKNRQSNNTNGEGSFFSKDSLYVTVNNPNDPKYQKLYVTKSGFLIRILGSKGIIIDGGKKQQITLKYGGRYAIGLQGDLGNLEIKNLKFENTFVGIYLFDARGKTLRIANNNFSHPIDQKWIWQDIKGSLLESTAVSYAKGTAKLVVENNVVEGLFNGIRALPGYTTIRNNTFINIGDDAVELDGPAINTVVHNNFFYNCFTAISLCPVREGPVYIYDNVIYSEIDLFPYSKKKDGSIRMVSAKTFKIWNLPTKENTFKDGEQVTVSKNCHIYYNTLYLKNNSLSIGTYNKKFRSPENIGVYNNIILSDGSLVYSSGFIADQVILANNLFHSYSKDKFKDKFIGWNGNMHFKHLPASTTLQWPGNMMSAVCLKNTKKKFDFSGFQLDTKSVKKILKVYSPYKLPAHFPHAEMLNRRKIPGINSSTQ